MSSPAQRAGNVQRNSRAKTAPGKAQSHTNSLLSGPMGTPEWHTPADVARVNELIVQMRAEFPNPAVADEIPIRNFALAVWRNELLLRFERWFYESSISQERMLTGSAVPFGPLGDEILLLRAIRRDYKGPGIFSKLFLQRDLIEENLDRARDAYFDALDRISREAESGPRELLM